MSIFKMRKVKNYFGSFIILNWAILMIMPVIFTWLYIWWSMSYGAELDDFLDEDLFFIYSSINNPITLFMIGAWDKERVLDAILILPLLRYIIILCYVNLESKKVVLSISILLWLFSSWFWFLALWAMMSV